MSDDPCCTVVRKVRDIGYIYVYLPTYRVHDGRRGQAKKSNIKSY